MEHGEIDKFNLIDRYLMGKLMVEESASFEEHFVACPQCIARLQTTKNLIQGLRLVAAEEVSQIDSPRPKRAWGYFLQIFQVKPLVLAMGCLLIAVAVSSLGVINYTRRLRAEVNQAESLAKQWEERFENERQAAILANGKHQEATLQQAEQLRALEAKEAQRAKIEAQSGWRARAEGNLRTFTLASIRSGPNNPESINQIAIPDSAAIFAFSIQLEGEPQFKDYRITIYDKRQALVLKKDKVTPDPDSDSLSIWFKHGFFRPGNYSLTVESFKKGGEKVVIGKYPFSIIKTS